MNKDKSESTKDINTAWMRLVSLALDKKIYTRVAQVSDECEDEGQGLCYIPLVYPTGSDFDLPCTFLPDVKCCDGGIGIHVPIRLMYYMVNHEIQNLDEGNLNPSDNPLMGIQCVDDWCRDTLLYDTADFDWITLIRAPGSYNRTVYSHVAVPFINLAGKGTLVWDLPNLCFKWNPK